MNAISWIFVMLAAAAANSESIASSNSDTEPLVAAGDRDFFIINQDAWPEALQTQVREFVESAPHKTGNAEVYHKVLTSYYVDGHYLIVT